MTDSVLPQHTEPASDRDDAGGRRHDQGSRRRFLLTSGLATGMMSSAAPSSPDGSLDREFWVTILRKVAEPVLTALSERRLRSSMPVETAGGADATERGQYTHLEAIGRLLSGIAPWLEANGGSKSEVQLRERYRELARRSIAAAVDPSSPDFLNFNRGSQPVVDAAFLALALLRAPEQLWNKLSPDSKRQTIRALQSSRVIRPGFNNWLLFSATVEAFLGWAGESHDDMRIDYAVRQHEEWYKGDGLYGDGPQFHWDYYNSFVIHPMLLKVVETASTWSDAWKGLLPAIQSRATRYAAIQERLISPEGTFPPIGRSLAYRCGAFHLLADMAVRRNLPQVVAPEQVRCALTAVIRKTLEAPGTFDANGWLTIGFCGHQRNVAERYISTGSLYLCSAVLLPLGLPEADPFWAGPAKDWTAQAAWSGGAMPSDHAL